MANRQTAKIANGDLLNGNQLYVQRARIVLPYLVRQAKAAQTIYYSALAKEVGMPNARNLNFVLGAIGKALIDLSVRTKKDIPAIQGIVINKTDELPGEGFGWFLKDFDKLNKTQKQKIVKENLSRIYSFQEWDRVLEELDLEPIRTNYNDDLSQAKKFGGGESAQHLEFKNYVANNPSALKLDSVPKGQTEYRLPSTDEVDVLFMIKGLKIGVEVKSIISDNADIFRGLFQCVKYKYLIEAEQAIKNEIPNCRVILALQGQFPQELMLAKNLLGIEVIDNINSAL